MTRTWKRALLDRLRQQRILDEPSMSRLAQQDAAPVFVGLLAGVAAWFAALLLVGSLFLSFIHDSPSATALVGVLLLGLAIWLLRQPGVSASQAGLALSLAGQGMLLLAVSSQGMWTIYSERPVATLAALVATGMLSVPASIMHRRACALIIMGAGGVLVGANEFLALFGVLLAALAAWIWLTRSRWAGSRRAGVWRALGEAATLVALVLPLFMDNRGAPVLSGLPGYAGGSWLAWLYPVGASLLLLAVSQYLLRGGAKMARLGALGAALLLTLAGILAPGLLVAAALWLAVFHAADRFWCMQVGLGVALYLMDFYYSLHISLLQKSALLIVGGAILLGLRWWLLRQRGGGNEG